MSTATTPDRISTRGRGIPRWVFVLLGLFVWLVGVPLAHGILPWALSWLAPRYGWTAGYPGTWNWLGLIAIAAGTAVLIWDFASGLARARELPERMQRLAPPFLMTTGPQGSLLLEDAQFGEEASDLGSVSTEGLGDIRRAGG